MRDSGRYIEIVFSFQGYGVTSVFDRAAPVENNVHLIFVWILNGSAFAVGVYDCLTVASYADNHG
jgi:hypothetical protein